jgi:hypothetical protein
VRLLHEILCGPSLLVNFDTRQPTRGDVPACRLGKGLTNPHRKKQLVMKCYTEPQTSYREHSNEPSVSINFREFIDWQGDYQLPKKDAAQFHVVNWLVILY